MALADEVARLAPVFADAGERFHLVGHSYGGAVALVAALTDPARVASLALFEPVLFSVLMAADPAQPAAQEIVAVRDETTAALRRGDPAAAGARFVDYWMGPGAWARMPDGRRETVTAAMPGVAPQWDAIFGEPAPLAAFSALEMPVLLLGGSASPASAREVARLLGKTLPRVSAVEIEGAGHMGPVTHPDPVNALIDEFLATAERTGART